MDDVAYAFGWFAPAENDDLALEWHHFPTVPDRRARIRDFLDAYGPPPEFNLVKTVIAGAEVTMSGEAQVAAQGEEPQLTWIDDGSLERQRVEVRWIREHRDLLT